MSWLYDIVGIEAFLVLLAPLTGFAHKCLGVAPASGHVIASACNHACGPITI